MSSSGPRPWWKAVVTYPPTWIAGAALAASVWAILAVVQPGGILAAGVIVAALAAAAAWPFTMSATGTLADLQFAIPRIEEVDPLELEALATQLQALDDKQPAEQLAALQLRRQGLVKVLEHRLDAGELTYSRYLATAQDVYLSALDNLKEVAIAQQSIATIDPTYIERRLQELAGDDSDAQSAERERDTLARRSEMRTTQRSKIARLLAQNESALTALDRTTTALADVPIGKRPEDADAAMKALEELADRASLYGEQPSKGIS